MDSLDDRIASGIDGEGIYFVKCLDNNLLSSLKNRLGRTIIGVFANKNGSLTIEAKGLFDDAQVIEDLEPFIVSRDDMEDGNPDLIVDSEKFLRSLFRGGSVLSTKYVVLIDIGILDRSLVGNDGRWVKVETI